MSMSMASACNQIYLIFGVLAIGLN